MKRAILAAAMILTAASPSSAHFFNPGTVVGNVYQDSGRGFGCCYAAPGYGYYGYARGNARWRRGPPGRH